MQIQPFKRAKALFESIQHILDGKHDVVEQARLLEALPVYKSRGHSSSRSKNGKRYNKQTNWWSARNRLALRLKE
jgi:hypothetical protein